MPRTIWSLFLTGLVLGYGPCLLSCGPLLVSYITARQDTPGKGLLTYGIFALTRIAVYLVFGVLAGLVGEWVLHRFFESFFLQVLFSAFGLLLIIFGLLVVFSKFSIGGSCHRFLERTAGPNSVGNAALFGLVVSFAPCLPLIAVLGYIVLIADSWTKGLVYMFSFGLGTVLSPMIILAIFAGWTGRAIKKNPWIAAVVNVACGLVLVYLGTTFLLSSLSGS